MTQQLHIVEDAQPTEQRAEESVADAEPTEIETPAPAPSPYESAEPVTGPLWEALGAPSSRAERRQRQRFAEAVAREVGREELVEDVRVVDAVDPTSTDDVDLGVLLAFPDDALLFVGIDPTARDAVPLFAFVIGRRQPIPQPETAAEALDLLKPGDVRDAIERDGDTSDRQGEWWLLPTAKVPVSSSFRPGVNAQPYGPSPLGNHVPREYAFTVTDDAFMTGVREQVPELPSSVTTPPEAIEWIYRQRRKRPTPEYAPEWGTIREIAGDILVRGTLRHRENDHYVEDLGEQWHEAQTHDMDVYTGDELVDRVVLD